ESRSLLAAAFPEFVDPHPNPGNQFGASVVPLSTGNVVVASPYDDAGGLDAGAVYLLNGATGELISTITGSSSGDRIGEDGGGAFGLGGIRALSNGNFVIISPQWEDAGAKPDVGAVTFGNGITGISGVVSSANSLIGSTAGDQIGSPIYGLQDTGENTSGVIALANGNYVVRSMNWDNGGVANAGAVTFGNGMTGTTGVITSGNSLVGSRTNDLLGNGGLYALSNGNYVVSSPGWDVPGKSGVGAVTFGNGTTGIVGTISEANSLVGTTAGDMVGNDGITTLSNGNYVVKTRTWDNGPAIVGTSVWSKGVS
ncbi:MAG: hypothetical protein KDA80_11285, partial [Planctomycetaceae bacterium]|nr:hypothetical protein [Planctomycetaceae bacterium]